MVPGLKAKFRAHFLGLIGLQTPQARLAVITGVSIALRFVSYENLIKAPSISLYSHLGLPSPSIGLTRAYWLLIHGNFKAAWNMNKLVYLVGFVLFGIVVADITRLLKQGNYTGNKKKSTSHLKP